MTDEADRAQSEMVVRTLQRACDALEVISSPKSVVAGLIVMISQYIIYNTPAEQDDRVDNVVETLRQCVTDMRTQLEARRLSGD